MVMALPILPSPRGGPVPVAAVCWDIECISRQHDGRTPPLNASLRAERPATILAIR